jgi:hypothetical protein
MLRSLEIIPFQELINVQRINCQTNLCKIANYTRVALIYLHRLVIKVNSEVVSKSLHIH